MPRLVINRKAGQSVTINGPCVVKVVEYRGGSVRLAIEADASVNIVRTELIEKRKESQ